MVGGRLIVGLDDASSTRLATADDVAKLSVRDLAVAAAIGADGATTVAAPARSPPRPASRVFATGGLGGVHRDAARPSTSRPTWSRSPVPRSRWSAPGVKSILDVGATLERLETLGVAVVGYRHPPLPRLLHHRQRLRPGLVAGLAGTGRRRAARPAPRRACTPARWSWPTRCRSTNSSTRSCTTGSSPTAWRCWSATGITGKAGDAVPARRTSTRATGGASLAVNVRIILRNAALAAQIAVARAASDDRSIVVGDLVTDVLAVLAGRSATGSDTPAAIRVTGGGQAANTAAWLAWHGVRGDARRRGRRRRGRARPGSPSCARPACDCPVRVAPRRAPPAA